MCKNALKVSTCYYSAPDWGGGYLENTSRFSLISFKRTEISAPNFQYLLVNQFYTSCLNKNFVPIISRPEMTSEWRHVLSILMQNKVLRESLSQAQFFLARTKFFWHEVTRNWWGYKTTISDFQNIQKWKYMSQIFSIFFNISENF